MHQPVWNEASSCLWCGSLGVTVRIVAESPLPTLQVERQIDQMVRFIKQEAEEKANEISVSAEEV